MKTSDGLVLALMLAALACAKPEPVKEATVALPDATTAAAASAAAAVPDIDTPVTPMPAPVAPTRAGTSTAKVAPVSPKAPAPAPAAASVPVASAPVGAAVVPDAKPAAPRSVPPTAVPVRTVSADDSTGKMLYMQSCRKCHGAAGVPGSAMKAKFPKLATFDAAFFARRSVDSIVTVLENGKGDGMKSFKDKLSASEMKAVAVYTLTLGK